MLNCSFRIVYINQLRGIYCSRLSKAALITVKQELRCLIWTAEINEFPAVSAQHIDSPCMSNICELKAIREQIHHIYIYVHEAFSLVVQCELYCLCVKISIVNIFYLAACDTVVMLCVVMFVLAHTIEVAS